MLKFVQSQQLKRILLIVVPAGLFFIVLWLCSASAQRLRNEAEKSPLSLALYAAKRSGRFNSEQICKVAVAFAEAGDFNRAQLIINDVEETEYFIFSSFRRFQFSKQLDFNMNEKAKSLVELAGLYVKTGRKDKALEMLSQALKIVERIETAFYSEEPLIKISSKFAELGEDRQALKIIESANPDLINDEPERLASFRHNLLLKLAEKYLEAGRYDQAIGILERAMQIDNIKDTFLKSADLAETGVVYAMAGQNQKANELLSKSLAVISTARGQSEQDKSMYLTIVAEGYAKSGFCQQAYEVSNSISIEHNRSYAQERVTSICSKGSDSETFKYTSPEIAAALKLIEVGEYKKGMIAIQDIGRQYMISGELVDVARRLAQDGKYDLAVEVTRAIVSDYYITDHIPYVPSKELRAEAISKIALLYARDGRKDKREMQKFLRELLIHID